MNKILAYWVFCIVSWAYALPSYAEFKIPIYEQLVAATDKALMTPRDENESMQKAIAVLVGCKMEKLCVLMVMHRMSVNEDNLIYIYFYNQLKKERDEIMYTAMHCQTPKFKQVHALQASCLADLRGRLSNFDTREKAEQSLQACLKSRMIRLAKTENVFARNEMYHYEIDRSNAKGFNYWQDKINLLIVTPQYSDFAKCGNRL